MAFDAGHGSEPTASINVTPLVDVVLVLLVVLMVTASTAVSEALPLDLPKASASNSPEPTLLRVGISADGRLSLDGAAPGEPVTLEAVRARASLAARSDAGARAAIAADGNARHQRVIEVMDALRKGGVTRLAVQTAPESAP
jgi:biopolymer transport protein ExbD